MIIDTQQQTDTDIYVIVYSVWRWSLHKQSSGREATDNNRHTATDRHRHTYVIVY